MWLNGKEREQAEEVEPKVTVPEMGVECMKSMNAVMWSSLKTTIQEIREEEMSDEGDVEVLDDETGEWYKVQQSQEY
jgi:hypothetical protein